jgi:hypothetical protein
MNLRFMAFPGNDFAGPGHFVAFVQGDSALTSKLLKPLLIDAGTAQVIDSRELPNYVAALLRSQPLHFGDYGGYRSRSYGRCSMFSASSSSQAVCTCG